MSRAARRRGGDEIEDPRAAVALVQAVVPPDLVEHLRPQPDMADRAEAVSGFGHGDTLAPMGHALEERQRVARQQYRMCGGLLTACCRLSALISEAARVTRSD